VVNPRARIGGKFLCGVGPESEFAAVGGIATGGEDPERDCEQRCRDERPAPKPGVQPQRGAGREGGQRHIHPVLGDRLCGDGHEARTRRQQQKKSSAEKPERRCAVATQQHKCDQGDEQERLRPDRGEMGFHGGAVVEDQWIGARTRGHR